MIWNIRKQKQAIRTTMKKNEDSISSLWGNFTHSNIHIIGIPEGEEQEIGNQFEKIMKENFPIW